MMFRSSFAIVASAVSLAAFGCATGNDLPEEGPFDLAPGRERPATSGDAGAPDEPLSPPEPEIPIDTTPHKITGGAATLNGMTSDGHVVYFTSEGVHVVAAEPGAEPVLVTGSSPLVAIRGRVVFAFTNVNYTTGVAELTIWTRAGGVQKIGSTLFAEDMFAASDDGSRVLFTGDLASTTMNLYVASTGNAAERTALVGPMGRAAANTCRPRFGFVRESVIAAWCAVGSMSAWLARYAPPSSGASWAASTIATEVQPTWVGDPSGQRVFFITSGYRGMVFQNDAAIPIDNGVTWATFAENGGALLYTVSDQLRRTSLPAVNPTPVVTVGFSARTAFSPNQAYALYSTTVSYEGIQRRDLLLASTAKFNPQSDRLVDEPKAQIPRSAFTNDSRYVLYLTEVDAYGGTLNARAIGGGPVRTFPRVDNAVAGHRSRVVFSDGRSDPSVYPVTGDLKSMDLARPDEPPFVFRAGVLDGRTVQITPDRSHVVYAVPRTESAPGDEGIWIQGIP